MDEKLDILLSRYFTGEANENELQQLDMWLAESKENEVYFDNMTMLFQQAALTPSFSDFENERALSEFKDYINKDEAGRKKRIFRIANYYRAIAASIILLAGAISFMLIYNTNSDKQVQLVALDEKQQYNINDGIEVILDTESKIQYNSGKNNEVELIGKATFSVNLNEEESEKLLVHAGETYIRDIGTVFTVTAYPSDNYIEVEVDEGEVLFFTEDNAGISVKENQKARYNTSTKQFNYILDNSEYIKNELVFSNATLNEIANTLEFQYGVKILIKPEPLKKVRLNVSFENNESIDNVLMIISETLSVKIIKNENTYIISK